MESLIIHGKKTFDDISSFMFTALGYFLCSTPAVSDFCLLTACGVMMDYAFQITFYASIMVYGGRKEATGGLLSCCYRQKSKCKQNERQHGES